MRYSVSVFFFFNQKTAYEMRISDWSSDVCSSDVRTGSVMNLHHLLQARAAAGRPVRIALIGAGQFGSMFLAQARLTPGFHVAVVADLNVEKALQAPTTTGWAKEQFAARGLDDALKSGANWVTDDDGAIFKPEAIEETGKASGGVEG